VIESRRFAIVDPFERHAGNIGAQDLLRQRIALRHEHVVAPIQNVKRLFLYRLHGH
jgi:hypothetical protein